MKKQKLNNNINVYEGIKFKSTIEKTCFVLLTEAKIEFEYEKDIYVLLDKFKYPSMESMKKKGKKVFINNPTIRSVKYTPDFTGTFSDGKKWVIETKGMRTTTFNIKWKMFKHLLITEGKDVSLFMPTNKQEILKTIEEINNYEELSSRSPKAAKSRNGRTEKNLQLKHDVSPNSQGNEKRNRGSRKLLPSTSKKSKNSN